MFFAAKFVQLNPKKELSIKRGAFYIYNSLISGLDELETVASQMADRKHRENA